jgi:hypothetical protein
MTRIHDIPVACSLGDPEFRDRERTVFAAFAAHVRGIQSHADGYTIDMGLTLNVAGNLDVQTGRDRRELEGVARRERHAHACTTLYDCVRKGGTTAGIPRCFCRSE